MIDFHVHCEFSSDSITPMEEIIKSAIEKNVHTIAMTDHVDFFLPKDGKKHGWTVDKEAYNKEINRLNHKYGDRIKILRGVELGALEIATEMNVEYIDDFFDFVIFSKHVCMGEDMYSASYYNQFSKEEIIKNYYEEYYECCKAFKKYSVLGHLDLPFRYNKDFMDVPQTSYFPIIEKLLRMIIEEGKGIEVNTGAFRYGLSEPNPNMEIMKMYKNLGGKILTFGSDAHKPEGVNKDFDLAIEYIEKAGFDRICIFENMKPIFIPIEKFKK